MKYSESFIAKIKEVYADSPTIIALAENGDTILGRYLDDSSSGTLSPQTVLDSTYEELVEWAKKMQAKRELYKMFTTGACYGEAELMENMCPALYLQNNGDPDKNNVEAEICKTVGFVGYFPSCKMWGCKQECWKKYQELKNI